MKPDIHPAYKEIKVTCTGCGNTFMTSSTKQNDLSIEICSNCHPFYSGQQKLIQTDRIKQFADRYSGKKSTASTKSES